MILSAEIVTETIIILRSRDEPPDKFFPISALTYLAFICQAQSPTVKYRRQTKIGRYSTFNIHCLFKNG